MTPINNQNGFSSVAAVMTLILLSITGLTVGYLTAVGEEEKTSQLSGAEAYYIAHAGSEHAIKKIYSSESPLVSEPGIDFGRGSFIVAQSGNVLTITGRSGNATRTMSMTSPTQADCTPFDVSNAIMDGNDKLHHIYFNKICLTQTTVDKMILSWTPDNGEKVEKVRIENTYVYNNPLGQGSGELLELANYTVNNANQNEISKIEFDSSMEDNIFTLTIIMLDQSTREATFGPL